MTPAVLNMVCWVSLPRSWQQGTAGVASVRKGQGLPHAGHSWSQPAPIGPWQDTAEPTSDTGGTSVITHLRKGKTQHKQWGGREKNVTKKPCKHQAEKGRRGRRCSRTQIPICAPRYRYYHADHKGSHAGGGGYVLKEAGACGEPMLEQRKSVRRKEWQRWTTIIWP